MARIARRLLGSNFKLGDVLVKPIGRAFSASILCAFAWLILECCAAGQVPSLEKDWIEFPECPVLADRVVPIPAQESGILQELLVGLNAAVKREAPVAQLDQDLAQTEVELANLQYSLSKQLAEDESDIEYHRVALQQVELELENHQLLGRNVNESEIRRLMLAVERAKLALTKARQAKSRAIVEAQIQYANFELANKRLKRRTITAPMDGVISEIVCQAGEWVEVGKPILELTNLDELKVDRLVPASDVQLSTIVGSQVWIELPAHLTATKLLGSQNGATTRSPKAGAATTSQPTRLQGRISSFDHEISAQGYIRLHARVQNQTKDGRWLLLPGMTVSMWIPNQHVRSGAETALRSEPNAEAAQVPKTAAFESFFPTNDR